MSGWTWQICRKWKCQLDLPPTVKGPAGHPSVGCFGVIVRCEVDDWCYVQRLLKSDPTERNGSIISIHKPDPQHSTRDSPQTYAEHENMGCKIKSPIWVTKLPRNCLCVHFFPTFGSLRSQPSSRDSPPGTNRDPQRWLGHKPTKMQAATNVW